MTMVTMMMVSTTLRISSQSMSKLPSLILRRMSYTLCVVKYDKGDDLGEDNEGSDGDDDDKKEENDHDDLDPLKDVVHALCCTI